MPIDAEFLKIVEELRVPIMGSDTLAPLLYSLVRFTRPRRVLEIGSGYTTPFIARALEDNFADHQHEMRGLAGKSRTLLQAIEGGLRLDAQHLDQWSSATPALASPQFYISPYQPVVVAVDSFTVSSSSAPRVSHLLEQLGLQHRVTLINGDFRQFHDQVVSQCAPIDFAWVDCDQALAFFDQYWQDINPRDGLLLFHWLLTDGGGETVLQYIKSKQQIRNDLEIVSFWEPHKFAQNSVTIIRKTARKNRVFGDKSALVQDAREFIRSRSKDI